MLDGLGENNRAKEALKMFEQMSIQPNNYTYSILFKLCTQSSDHQSFEFCQTLWKNISINSQKNPIVSTSFLQLLIKHASISTCEQFFSQINKNNITYTAMMKGYILHQMPQKAIDLYVDIEKPDEITTTTFFNACAELKDNKTLILAEKVFSQLPHQFLQSRLLLQSIFNMFCRCNHISNAEIIFEQIERNVITYGSLMKAYNDQDLPEKTLELFERMKKENIKGNSIIFVLLINACANIHFYRYVNQLSNKFLRV
ncbi:hypothetical protein I4U23_021133 [Adineta vaga]|nr:hypothetical protein I4U23_021133 [Adineta vaga]